MTVLREMTKDKIGREKGDASLLALGNPVIGNDEQRNEELCPLPEAETEVKTVAKTPRAVGNKVLIGREASERLLKHWRRLTQLFTSRLMASWITDSRFIRTCC